MAFLRDRYYLAALAAGPVAWCMLGMTVGVGEHWPAPAVSLRNYLILSLLYPIVEELVFRGWLQGTIARFPRGKQRFGPVSGANLVTSGVFVGMHLFSHSLFAAFMVMFPSLVFGYFRDRYNRVTPSIVLHAFYNSGYFWLFG